MASTTITLANETDSDWSLVAVNDEGSFSDYPPVSISAGQSGSFTLSAYGPAGVVYTFFSDTSQSVQFVAGPVGDTGGCTVTAPYPSCSVSPSFAALGDGAVTFSVSQG